MAAIKDQPATISSKDGSAIRTPIWLVAAAAAFLILRALTGLTAQAAGNGTAGGAGASGGGYGSGGATIWQNAARMPEVPDPDGRHALTVLEFRADWSDPCKTFESTTLTNREVDSLLSQHFDGVQITDQSRERGKNPQWLADLEKRYRVFALPTVVVVDRDGEQVSSLIGNCSSLTTYRFLTRTLNKQRSRQS
jgi:thiol:disulfide interchange protein